MFTLRLPKLQPAVIAARLAILAVLGLAATAWIVFAHVLATAEPVPHVDVPQPNAVVWHGRVYQSRAKLAGDLRRRGKSYVVWARNHEGAAALLARLAAERRRG